MAVESGRVSEYTGKSLADVVPEGQLYELHKWMTYHPVNGCNYGHVTFKILPFAVMQRVARVRQQHLSYLFLSTCQEIGWEVHLQNDLFYVRWNVKPQLNQTVSEVKGQGHDRPINR